MEPGFPLAATGWVPAPPGPHRLLNKHNPTACYRQRLLCWAPRCPQLRALPWAPARCRGGRQRRCWEPGSSGLRSGAIITARKAGAAAPPAESGPGAGQPLPATPPPPRRLPMLSQWLRRLGASSASLKSPCLLGPGDQGTEGEEGQALNSPSAKGRSPWPRTEARSSSRRSSLRLKCAKPCWDVWGEGDARPRVAVGVTSKVENSNFMDTRAWQLWQAILG